MSIFDVYNKECEISLMKLNHYYESNFDRFNINLITESDCSVVEESVSDLAKKVVEFIEKIIKTIGEYLGKIKDGFVNFFDKEKKDKLEEISKANANNNEKVEIADDKRYKDMLDEYIQEITKLERKLMKVRLDSKINPLVKDSQANIECMLILKEMDKLNEKFDKDFLNDNDDIIKLAKKDAIRFSEKQLDNVKVDYEAIEKGTNEILKEFKKDANGCDEPIKLNILQKMINSVSTRVRKISNKIGGYRHKNLTTILAFSAIAIGVKYAASNPKIRETVKNKVSDTLDKIKKTNEELDKKNAELLKNIKK